MTAANAPGAPERPPEGGAASLRIFINYRARDSSGDAAMLYEKLVGRFGEESVYLDQRAMMPGVDWLEQIKAAAGSCGVLLCLIGGHWMTQLDERARMLREGSAEADYVRLEIEHALRRSSGVHVIPVVLGDAPAPSVTLLPKSLHALATTEAHRLGYKTLEQDTRRLLDRLEAIALEPLSEQPPPAVVRRLVPLAAQLAPAPDDRHMQEVLRHMVDWGNLVPLLGSRINGGQSGSLPDADALAGDLARQFGIEPRKLDLAEIAQYVFTTIGDSDLYGTLKLMLTGDYEPGPVHCFLASIPRRLAELGLERHYQMLVTTNFDMALERAFDAEREPYDLAVYMASGPDKGKFVHFQPNGSSTPIVVPNRYFDLPIDDDHVLERTLIVKIHGAVDGRLNDYRWSRNYVITEDHYIDYLSTSPVSDLVPVQILDKLKNSHCLFLGYTMHDWILRVFLKRIWGGEQLGTRSWAIEHNPDMLEQRFWATAAVDLYQAELGDYVRSLDDRLSERRAA